MPSVFCVKMFVWNAVLCCSFITSALGNYSLQDLIVYLTFDVHLYYVLLNIIKNERIVCRSIGVAVHQWFVMIWLVMKRWPQFFPGGMHGIKGSWTNPLLFHDIMIRTSISSSIHPKDMRELLAIITFTKYLPEKWRKSIWIRSWNEGFMCNMKNMSLRIQASSTH